MAFKIVSDQFSVSRDSAHFIQIKTLRHPQSSDELWVALCVEGDSRFAKSTAQSLIDTLETVFFDRTQANAYERFENALREANLIYKSLKEKRGGQELGSISGLVAAFSGNQLHLTQSKEAEAYLIRKDRLSSISEGLSTRSEDLFMNIASGELLPEDKVLLSTSRLLRLMSHNQIVSSCKDGVAEATDAIRELVMEGPGASLGMACLHLKLGHRSAAGSAESPPSELWGKLKGSWERLLGKAESILAERKLPLNRKSLLAAILALILVLILSVSALMESSHKRAVREEYSLRIEAMNKELDNANNKGYAGEKETANAILGEVEAEANKILKEDFFREEILVLLGKVQKIRDDINNTLRLADAKPYSELSSNGQPAQAIGLTGLGKTLFAFSPNRLHEVVLGQSMEPKAIDGGEAAVKAAPMEDQEAVVLLTASGRILEYGEGNFTFMSTEDESWKSAVDLAAYGKYLYLLSPQNNQIYKYGRLRSGYSGATEYSKGAQLEGALSMAIDGSVYVLRQGGEIIKLFKSQQEDFRIENLPTSLEGATQIFTSPELKHLYVLDPGGKRVLVLQKDTDAGAKYIGQISFEDLEGVKSIFVQKEEDSLFLLAPSAIYQADLKQLY